MDYANKIATLINIWYLYHMVLYYTYIFGTNEHMVLILLVTKITAIWVL